MPTQHKVCQKCQAEFLIEERDRAFYVSLNVPEPTFCPECRLRRRLAWINFRSLYLRPLANSQKPAISMYAPDSTLNIVDDRAWWSEEYDMLTYGATYDFSRPFFEQFRELMKRVPLPHLQRNHATLENSEYCNGASALKNCYLIMAAVENENCYYGYTIDKTKDSVDCAFVIGSELCYEAVNCVDCYKTRYSQDCEQCSDILFCIDCTGCSFCFGCSNLKNKSYHIFNRPYSPEEYARRIQEYKLSSYSGVQRARAESRTFHATQPKRYMHGRLNDDTSGDYISQSHNMHDSYMVSKADTCRYCSFLRHISAGTVNAYDYSLFGHSAEYIYECGWCGYGSSSLRFCYWCYGSNDCTYSFGCHSADNLFGCVGMRKKQWCVLNKQYSQQEYKALIPKIRAHMDDMPFIDAQGIPYRYGEFFPSDLSPFHYNETIAQDFLPLDEGSASANGFSWHRQPRTDRTAILSSRDLPDNIHDCSDEATKKTISCGMYEDDQRRAERAGCTRIFKLVPQEMVYYHAQGIPLPRMCHNCRHAQRIAVLNPMNAVWTRACDCKDHNDHRCDQTFQTSYAPERAEIIYCEKCYSAVVY